MRSMHKVSPDRGQDSGREELDSIRESCSGVKDSALADRHELSEDDESWNAEDFHGESGIEKYLEINLQHQPRPTPHATLPPPPPSLPLPARPSQQQSSSGSVIHWERFLPFQTLKVLLVEKDDSTRHVLSALLRNCSYEVTAVENGLEAWKILEDLYNHVDIVLTEVVMPGLSGIGLLCKIINHKSCQNVPVIMMSSHDSMGLVFKCLSKGAVDFLIKPIRKNELKNLWQHVWRRCHSSSGSGSESGVQTNRSDKHWSADESGNGSDSDYEYEDTSIDLNMQDGSDNGSGTQSSWSKQAAVFESLQTVSPCNQLPEPLNSTCAQVIHPKTETFRNEWLTRTTIKDHCIKKVLDQELLRKDSEIWAPGEPHNQLKWNSFLTVLDSTLGSQTDKYQNAHLPRHNHQNNAGKETTSSSPQAAHFTSGSVDHEILTSNIEVPNSHKTTSKNKDQAINNMRGSLQLNMKKLTSVGESETIMNDVRILLGHSGLSAFTRYNTSAASNQVPVGWLGRSSNNNDMGSSTQNVSIKAPAIEKPSTQTAMKGPHSSAFRPVQKQNPPTQEALIEKSDHFRTDASAIIAQPRVFHHGELEPHNSGQHHHHVHNMQQLPPLAYGEHALTNVESNVVPQFGSSNVFVGGIEFDTAHYSVNGSISGSNHGSNALNCCSAVIDVGRNNIDNNRGSAGRCGVGSGNEEQSASGSACGDHNEIAQKEALLNKFRQKRKERCFEKKVQCQRRKKFAEQRLCILEQFVPQPTCNQRNNDS